MLKPAFHGVLLALSLAVLLTGCESVSSTAQFYRPSTARVFTPKPKDYAVPIFSKPPDRPYTVIGRLSFTANASYDFMIRAIQ